MTTLSLHSLKKYFPNLVRKIQLRSQIKRVENSQLFDTQWYLEQYPDVASSGVNPLTHFLLSGAAEGRDPSPLFDTQWYLEQYPDVAKSGINPLLHYLNGGVAQGHNPNPLFDTKWYSEHYSIDKTINPLTHYLSHGETQYCDPSPFFSTKEHLDQHPELKRIGINPLAHYYRRNTNWLEKIYPEDLALGPVSPIQSKFSKPITRAKMLVIGHDASPTGAPVLLLNIIKTLKESFKLEIAVILLTGGPLEADFRALAPTYIVDEEYKSDKNYSRFRQLALSLREEGYTAALCNTAVTGHCTKLLYQLGFTVISAIHEMRSVIEVVKLRKNVKLLPLMLIK